ncbi:MAG: acyltransferase [Propionibacteriaceae bacterium]
MTTGAAPPVGDPDQLPTPTPPGTGPVAVVRWMVANRFLTRHHLVGAARFLLARWRHPGVEFEGFCFLAKGVELSAAPGRGRIVIGPWVHLNPGVKIRSHEGTVRIGAKCVLGYDLTLNSWLDVEIGPATIIGDHVYVCDFDHRTVDVTVPIKDQGLVTAPVRIGADCWLGSRVTALRGCDLGDGSVVAAHAVAREAYPPGSVVAGVPGRVVADRYARYADAAEVRRYVDALGQQAAAELDQLKRGVEINSTGS